jgi:hypothetical protein
MQYETIDCEEINPKHLSKRLTYRILNLNLMTLTLRWPTLYPAEAAKRVKLIFHFFSAPLCDAVGEEGQTGGASSG